MPEPGANDDTGTQQVPPEINTNVPQSARVYDYWLGGKDHFPADRALGDAIAGALPTIRTQVRAQRAFLGRAVRYLTRDAGIHQYLDIGTGIPSAGNVHDVAQEVAPESRVLYVDNDPIVLAHARALMAGTAERPVAFSQADLREPEGDPGRPGRRRDPRPRPAGRPGPHRGHAPSPGRRRPAPNRRHPGRRAGARQLPGAVAVDPRLR